LEELNTGGRYNPATDSWTAITINNAPSARFFHTAVWSGNEMIVWGGTLMALTSWTQAEDTARILARFPRRRQRLRLRQLLPQLPRLLLLRRQLQLQQAPRRQQRLLLQLLHPLKPRQQPQPLRLLQRRPPDLLRRPGLVRRHILGHSRTGRGKIGVKPKHLTWW
jgi:hypothetical protein